MIFQMAEGGFMNEEQAHAMRSGGIVMDGGTICAGGV